MSLAGLKVVEFAGLAPGPFAGLVLADNGASVTRIDRPSATSNDVLSRGKRSIAIDSKINSGREILKRMIASADVVIDPFRPGVMERLGLGPDVFLGVGKKKGLNKRLIYARIVGFPRAGSQKDMAGHDINYIAMSGILSMMPGSEKPFFPLNILADFAGGGLMCAVGILLALIERGTTGRGQVINADMVSGARYVSSFPLIQSLLTHSPVLGGTRGTNALDGGAPFYNVYKCKDGGWISVGCLEPQFFIVFLEAFLKALPKESPLRTGWSPTPDVQGNRDDWPRLKDFLEKGFLTNTRDYWTRVFHGTDACTVPVLTTQEAGRFYSPVPTMHPRIISRQRGIQEDQSSGIPILKPGSHTTEVLRELGLRDTDIRQLVADGAIDLDIPKSSRGKL